jgi:hypothetical protein
MTTGGTMVKEGKQWETVGKRSLKKGDWFTTVNLKGSTKVVRWGGGSCISVMEATRKGRIVRFFEWVSWKWSHSYTGTFAQICSTFHRSDGDCHEYTEHGKNWMKMSDISQGFTGESGEQIDLKYNSWIVSICRGRHTLERRGRYSFWRKKGPEKVT